MRRQLQEEVTGGNSTNLRRAVPCALLPVVLGLAVYANSFNGQFVFDDDHLVRDNALIREWSHTGDIFASDIGAGSGNVSSSYRPLQIFTYLLDHSVWGLDVRGYHATNVLLHVGAALCLLWLVWLMFESPLLAVASAVLFVIHPVHTEAVSYISGRADPLALLFVLLSFVFYIKHADAGSVPSAVIMSASFALALLSRESSLILPVLILVYHWASEKPVAIKRLTPLIGVAFLYVILRMSVLRIVLPHSLVGTTVLQRLPGFFAAFTTYLRLLILPFGLHMEYMDGTFPMTDIRVVLGIVLFAMSLLVAFRSRKGLVFLGILWFFAALLPSSNIYPMNAYMAEHWLYLPSIGVFILAGRGLTILYERRSYRAVAIGLFLALVVFFSTLTIRQNTYWSDPVAFYTRTLKYSPDSYKSLNGLGVAYRKAGRDEDAIKVYERSVKVAPDNINGHFNLGNAYRDTGRTGEAIGSFEKAREIDPSLVRVHNNLGNVYSMVGRSDEAVSCFKRSIELAPEAPDAHYNLGNEHRKKGNSETAISSFERAIELDPTNPSIYNNLANTYLDMGNIADAIDSYKRAIEADPRFVMAYNNLAIVYYGEKRYDLAIRYFDRAAQMGSVDQQLKAALEPYR